MQTNQKKPFISRYVEEDEDFWSKHIAACSVSNLSKSAYCRENKINYARFFYWIKRLSAQSEAVCNIRKRPRLETNRLLPVQVIQDSKSHDSIRCTLILKNDCRLQIHDRQSLSQILTMWG